MTFFGPLKLPLAGLALLAGIGGALLPPGREDAIAVLVTGLVLLLIVLAVQRWFFFDHEKRETQRNAEVVRQVLREIGITSATLADIRTEVKQIAEAAHAAAQAAVGKAHTANDGITQLEARLKRIEELGPIRSALRVERKP